jgi:hypothetical protein
LDRLLSRDLRARLDVLLQDDRAAVSGPIVAEVTSGARTPAIFKSPCGSVP